MTEGPDDVDAKIEAAVREELRANRAAERRSTIRYVIALVLVVLTGVAAIAPALGACALLVMVLGWVAKKYLAAKSASLLAKAIAKPLTRWIAVSALALAKWMSGQVKWKFARKIAGERLTAIENGTRCLSCDGVNMLRTEGVAVCKACGYRAAIAPLAERERFEEDATRLAVREWPRDPPVDT